MTIYGDEVRNPSLSAKQAENKYLSMATPDFTPKNVKSGFFFVFIYRFTIGQSHRQCFPGRKPLWDAQPSN